MLLLIFEGEVYPSSVLNDPEGGLCLQVGGGFGMQGMGSGAQENVPFTIAVEGAQGAAVPSC